MKKVTVIIPCYNEAEGIGNVIQKLPIDKLKQYGYIVQPLVIDNNSTDGTAEVAEKAGATVVFEGRKGKGNAIRRGFASIPADTDYVVMIDGDDTYSPEELLRMIEPLDSDFCEVVIGSRLGGKMHDGAMPFANRGFNWGCAHIVRIFYRTNVTDVLTGYFAWKKSAVDDLAPHLKSNGFAIEMEMITRMARLGHEAYSVPISYHPRLGTSKIKPTDSIPILKIFFENLWWSPRRRAERAQ
jgi:dolichol-phosphate mannosyltransferase